MSPFNIIVKLHILNVHFPAIEKSFREGVKVEKKMEQWVVVRDHYYTFDFKLKIKKIFSVF